MSDTSDDIAVIREQTESDTVVILSSELIAQVMEVHFNKKMFKQEVKIVDLQPSKDGYAFSIAFVVKEREIKPVSVVKRDSKGKYRPKNPSDDSYQYEKVTRNGKTGEKARGIDAKV